MLYVAAVFLVLGLTLMGLDLGGVRWAHGAGVSGTMLALVALVLLIAKEVRVLRHHDV
jgi:hypothetical protein